MGMGLGVMAEEVVVSEMEVLPKPSGFSHLQAAAFPVGFLTSYHGLVQRGGLKSGEWLLITGVKLGAQVIAAVSSAEKAAVARKLGAQHVLDYTQTSDWKSTVNEITKGKMVDVCYEVVGGDVFNQCVKCMAPCGRLLIVGFASGTIPNFPVNLALVKGFSLVGVRSGAEIARDSSVLLEMALQLRELTANRNTDLAPYIDPKFVFPPSKMKQAFAVVASRQIVGKSVVQWRSEPDAKLASKL